MAQWTECRPVNQRVAGSIPSQSTCPVRAHAGQVSGGGHTRGNHTLMFLSLSFSLPYTLSLKISKIFKTKMGGGPEHLPQGRHTDDLRRCPTSLAIREGQIKAMGSYHLTPVRIAVGSKTRTNRRWRGCGENTLCTAGGNVN